MTTTTKKPSRPLVIDVHAHMLDPYVLELARNRVVLTGFGEKPIPPLPSEVMMIDPNVQLEHMDKHGIDIHLLTASGVVAGTSWADAATDLALCQKVNNTTAAWTRAHPKRFVGSFVLPLQDLHLAIPEMERAVNDLGFRVANLPANVHGIYLGDPRLRPLWDAIRRLGVVVWIHPDGVKDPWFQKYGLWNSLGQSIEEARVMASMMYEGIFDQYPDIKIVIAHGGGYFPHYMGRLDRNVTNLPDSTRNITRKPSEYLRSVYYDTCVYDPLVLAVLAERVGVDRLVMGSDYPVNMGHPVAFLKDTGLFSADDLAMIAGGTAASLLGLEARVS